MRDFYIHGSFKNQDMTHHFAEIVKGYDKTDVINKFIAKYGKDAYLHEITEVGQEIGTKID